MHDSWNRSNSTPPVILFATPPPLEDLRALTVRIDNHMQMSQPAAKFQPQVIKCREFIFTEPEVIGTPSLEPKDHCFHLVAQLKLLQSGKLQTRLSRVGLQVTKPYHVTPELYQSCLRYTLMARISPNWNKAEEWLVQGRDFLTHNGAVNAVKMDLSVNCNELYFALEATSLKISPLKVNDLDILGDSMEKFLKHHVSEISHDSIASDWCYVLPSMKRGKIMSISYEIPQESPFMSYRDLKRFWKNTYGYRLPESDEEMIYYQIHFGPLGGRLFTYPEVCLRAREIQRVARVDPKPILRAFMQEITAKFPTICGAPMKLQSKAKFPVAELFESGQKTPQCQSNLSNKMSSRPSAYRSKEEMEKILLTRPAITSQVCSHSQLTRTPGTDLMRSSTQNIYGSQAGQPIVTQTCKENHLDKPQYSGFSRGQINQIGNSAKHIPNSDNVINQISKGTPSKTVPENFNHSLSACQIQNPTTVAGTSLHTSHKSDQETPHQAQIVSQPFENMSQPAAIARRLFPQFKPKIITSKIVNTADNQGPKIKPVFNVQKKVNTLPVTTERSALVTNTGSVISNPQASSVSQSGVAKTVPLFFKKSVVGKNSVIEKQTIVSKIQNGGKRAKSSAAGNEKTPKRSKKQKDGDGKRKKLKSSAQKAEQ